MKGKLFKRLIACMLAMALVFQGFANVSIATAADDITFDVSNIAFSGGNGSGYVIITNNTTTKKIIKATLNYVCATSSGSDYSGSFDLGTVAINAGESVNANGPNGYVDWTITSLKSASCSYEEIVLNWSSVDEDKLKFADVTANGNISYTLEGSLVNANGVYFEYEIETTNGVKVTDTAKAQSGTTGWNGASGIVITAKITSIYYTMDSSVDGVTGRIVPKDDGTFDMTISSTKALRSVGVFINNVPKSYSDLGDVTSFTQNITPTEITSARITAATFGPFEAEGSYTNLTGVDPIEFVGLGYGYDGESSYYYYFVLQNNDEEGTLKSISVTGQFSGSSQTFNLDNCGIGPGEQKKITYKITGSNTSTQNDYKLSNPVLVKEEAPELHGIQDPEIGTTNVGNKAVIWSKVTFGKYNISSKTATEDIEWRVLDVDGDEAVIMTDQAIIKNLQYSTGMGNTTWATSNVRKYLNDTFIEDAFSEDDKKSIVKSIVKTKKLASSSATSADADTTDSVYILALEELKKYGFYNGTGDTVASRRIKMSEVVKDGSSRTYANYFLRNQGYYSYDVVGVNYKGKAVPTGWRVYANATVCPVIRVKTSALEYAGSTYAKIGANAEDVAEASISSLVKKRRIACPGDTVSKKKVTYTVITAEDTDAELPENVMAGASAANTVAVTAIKKGVTSVKIPSTITIDGQEFDVTGISKKAFAKAKKTLKTINLTKVDLDSIDKNAFKGLKADTVIKVTASQYKKVKKLVKNAASKAKVKKVS
ncbi:MAG: DUF6273 domain-containing protein [Lachnospiraceae bacterium]|nr:DUF6273 domain-containing protein [Lachnospiraceae bacterium]